MKDKITNEYIKIVGLPQPPYDPSWIKPKFLVDEDRHLEVNIGQAALGYLKSNLKEDMIVLIDNEVLKEKLLHSWKHYDDFCICCSGKKIYLLKTNFKDHTKAERILNSQLHMKIDLSASMTGTDGLTIRISDDSYAILLDEDANEKRLLHEFIHCVQFITKKIIDRIDGLSEEVKKYFGISSAYEDYMFNEKEFLANIYNDLFNDFQKNYWLHYKQMSWDKYVDAVDHMFKTDVSGYRESFFGYQWKNDKCSFLFLDLLACIAYVKPDFFSEIVEKLKNGK